MNHSNSQNQKYNSTKHKKKRLTQDQVNLLEASFDGNKKLEPELKLQLARELGVPPRQIAIWYQNKRARWKNQTLELDYNGLQDKLESVLAEKKQLEKEVKHLQEELQKVKTAPLMAAYPPVNSISSCCDDGGSGNSLYDDVSCSWVVNGGDHHHHHRLQQQPLQLIDDEFYPCFIGGGDGILNRGSRSWVNGDHGVFGINNINTPKF